MFPYDLFDPSHFLFYRKCWVSGHELNPIVRERRGLFKFVRDRETGVTGKFASWLALKREGE